MKLVIVGLGSIGKKHQSVLVKLGHKIVPCHRDDNLSQILKTENPDGVLVCNPNNLHIKAGLTVIRSGNHLFMEKPLSDNLDGAAELVDLAEKQKLVFQMGYVLRFDTELNKIKIQLGKGKIGKIYAARIEVGSYLPSWHPEEDYRQRYHSRKELGGGVIGDLSHELDYAYWLFGPIKKVTAMVKNVPDLKIETESLAEILMEHESGVLTEVHLDYLQKTPRRKLEVIGSEGNLDWDYFKTKADADGKFVRQMENFIDAINGKNKPKVTGADGLHVQAIIDAAKESNKSGKMITI